MRSLWTGETDATGFNAVAILHAHRSLRTHSILTGGDAHAIFTDGAIIAHERLADINAAPADAGLTMRTGHTFTSVHTNTAAAT